MPLTPATIGYEKSLLFKTVVLLTTGALQNRTTTITTLTSSLIN
jgi:hypothetical protein